MAREKIKVDVEKYFDDVHVLSHIDFSVKENEFVCLVGPSGCGKTVFLNVVAGLTPPSKGQVTMDGEVIDPQRHNIGFVFQTPSCLPWRTLWEDVNFGLEIKKVDRQVADARIDRVLKLVGLSGFEKFFPHQLSGGMKQRVAIARAFAPEPDLLLLDEPFGHLDAQTRYLMQIEILKIWEEMKRTVIFVTNNIEEALLLGERVIVFSPVPAKIVAEFPVNIARPRDPTDPEFLDLRKKITDYYKVD